MSKRWGSIYISGVYAYTAISSMDMTHAIDTRTEMVSAGWRVLSDVGEISDEFIMYFIENFFTTMYSLALVERMYE